MAATELLLTAYGMGIAQDPELPKRWISISHKLGPVAGTIHTISLQGTVKAIAPPFPNVVTRTQKAPIYRTCSLPKPSLFFAKPGLSGRLRLRMNQLLVSLTVPSSPYQPK